MNSEARAKLMDEKLAGLGLLPQVVCSCELNSCRNPCGYGSKIAFRSRKPSILCVCVCLCSLILTVARSGREVCQTRSDELKRTLKCDVWQWVVLFERIMSTYVWGPLYYDTIFTHWSFPEFKVHELEMSNTPTTSTTQPRGSHPFRWIIIKSSEPMVWIIQLIDNCSFLRH